MKIIKPFLIALPIFITIDYLWLGVLAKDFYFNQAGHLLKQEFNLIAAVSFYIIYNLGLIIFVIQPSLQINCPRHAISCGAFFGLVTYSTLDLTNLAILKDWPLHLSIVDMLWGTILTAIVSAITFFTARQLIKTN
ncbi:MAG: DUF2177 family protein [Methylacidiphilales bacterium]|nr:DUF2177 family protein [Candidatus Methylacidiphilales bacterium]